MKTIIVHSNSLPHKKFSASSLLIYDRILMKRVRGFAAWAKSFPMTYPVIAGERLKTIDAFPRHIAKIVALTRNIPRRDLPIVCVGGGSVCDFGGFVASVLKRGVKLTHIPSTWLAAIDAAHGGKTALNVGGVKNQVGTFYAAEKIYIVKELLAAQPPERVREAFSELLKIALLDGARGQVLTFAFHSNFFEKCKSQDLTPLLWKYLPDAIAAKYRIVEQDPFEQTGAREILNLGHTVGHVFEAYYGMSHGEAVARGLCFALRWSGRRYPGLLEKPEIVECMHLLHDIPLLCKEGRRGGRSGLPLRDFVRLLAHDKKRVSSTRLTFIFLKDVGKPVRAKVRLAEIIAEAKAQGIVA